MGVDKCLEAKTANKRTNTTSARAIREWSSDTRPMKLKTLMPIATLWQLNWRSASLTCVKSGMLGYLRPDGKTQVTVEYENGVAKRLDNIVVSTQHDADVFAREIREDMDRGRNKTRHRRKTHRQRHENFRQHRRADSLSAGHAGDTGLTGRKIIVDNIRRLTVITAAARSRQRPDKKSTAARAMPRDYVAKNIVAGTCQEMRGAGLRTPIGVAEPLCVNVDTFRHGHHPRRRRSQRSAAKPSIFAPREIIDYSRSQKLTIYSALSAYGHFGRESSASDGKRRISPISSKTKRKSNKI